MKKIFIKFNAVDVNKTIYDMYLSPDEIFCFTNILTEEIAHSTIRTLQGIEFRVTETTNEISTLIKQAQEK